MESTLSADKNRLAGQHQQQPKVELVEEDVSNSINEASSSYERHCSPSGQQLQQLGAQHLEPSFQSVKATKSVLFDTRSTTHAHNKKVQSGKKKIQFTMYPIFWFLFYAIRQFLTDTSAILTYKQISNDMYVSSRCFKFQILFKVQ